MHIKSYIYKSRCDNSIIQKAHKGTTTQADINEEFPVDVGTP